MLPQPTKASLHALEPRVWSTDGGLALWAPLAPTQSGH